MIIHILGPSGSGKTTLGKRISKIPNTVVVDTDDIDDPNSLKIVSKYSLDNKKNINTYKKEVAKKNKEDVDKIIKSNKGKNIVFVGFLHLGMDHLIKKIEKGFSIEVEPSTLWRQYNLRTIDAMQKNHREIKKLLESNMDDTKINIIFSKKFGIRNGFDCIGPEGLKKHQIDKRKENDIKNGYIYTKSDSIYDIINNILTTSY